MEKIGANAAERFAKNYMKERFDVPWHLLGENGVDVKGHALGDCFSRDLLKWLHQELASGADCVSLCQFDGIVVFNLSLFKLKYDFFIKLKIIQSDKHPILFIKA